MKRLTKTVTMKKPTHQTDGHRAAASGFSLIELVIVVLIIAILATIAIPIFYTSRAAAQLMGATQELKSRLDYARTVAIKEEVPTSLKINEDGVSYTQMVDERGDRVQKTKTIQLLNNIQFANGTLIDPIVFDAHGGTRARSLTLENFTGQHTITITELGDLKIDDLQPAPALAVATPVPPAQDVIDPYPIDPLLQGNGDCAIAAPGGASASGATTPTGGANITVSVGGGQGLVPVTISITRTSGTGTIYMVPSSQMMDARGASVTFRAKLQPNASGITKYSATFSSPCGSKTVTGTLKP